MKKLFLILITILTFSNAQSNWTFLSTVGTSTINTISVVNPSVIWVCCDANKVYRSVDGGLTWVLRNTGLPAGNLYGISALDTTNCWVGTEAGSIYRTNNGGISWTLQFSLAGSFSDGIKMFDLNYGVYYGDPTGNGQPYQFRYTVNGGTTWLLSPSAPIATNEFGVVNAWDWTDTSHFWIGSASTVANATTAKVYKTTSGFGGGGWSSATLTGNGGAAGLFYQAVAFTDNSNGMAGSNGSNLRKSIDGGVTWTTLANPPGITNYAAINLNALKDGSNTIRLSLVTVDSGFVFRTNNLGTTWTKEPLPPPSDLDGLQHMQFLNSALGYAGGAAGTFLRFRNTTVNIKLIIEGLYDATTDNLRKRDTVRAYLRNITTPFDIVDSALSVIDSVTLTGNFAFENAPSGTYYIHLKYRNGIETWSKTGGEAYIVGNTFSYDFTSAASQAFGNNMVQVDASPVRFAIYSGDVNQLGQVNLTDIILISNNAVAFVNGYVVTDLNGDNVTNLTDILIAFNNSNKFVAKIIPS